MKKGVFIQSKILLLFLFLFPFQLSAKSERTHRTLVKLPFSEREHVLRGMRRYLGSMERMLSALSRQDYLEVERQASTMLLDERKLVNLGMRENDQFIAAAMQFHTTGVTEIIKSARTKNMQKTLVSMSSFVGRCNACHESFRLIEWPAKDYPPVKPKLLSAPKDYKRSDWVQKEFIKNPKP